MQLPEEVPPLTPWPFLIGDAVLLATASLISYQSHAPLTGLPLLAITSCVALGATLAVIPFLLNHTRRQELELTDRQREISALAQTTATSAEQISIAVASLHAIAETTTRALKTVDLLPHKMQEKINDFKTQLNEVVVTENESLAQEINTLRTSETERLETALAGVRKIIAELAAIESSSRKQLADLNASLARFSTAAEQSADATAKTIETASAAAEKSLAEAQTAAANAIKESIATALASLGRNAAAETEPLVNTKTEDAAPAKTTLLAILTPPTIPPTVGQPSPAPTAAQESFDKKPPAPQEAEPVATSPTTAPAQTSVAVEEKTARKRAPRKADFDDNEPSLGLELPGDKFPQIPPDDDTPALSADGLTRLLVTAYIGIGNKVYVRGEGPGLSWDRGVPLHFVSIGKWCWESGEATTPLSLKLYKNDEYECTALGTLALQPGHQHEVTASFG